MSKEVRMLNEISKALGGAEHVQRKDILEEIAGLSDSLGPEQHILPPSQVDPETGLPTVEDPEEGAFYLVPSGEDEPNLYNEYIWTGEGWELFGSGGAALKNMVDGSAQGSVRGVKTAEESNSYTIGERATAEGSDTKASGYASHAEGAANIASGSQSHAEGVSTTASGNQSHTEGFGTTASGTNSHAEGSNTTASGGNSHAEGVYTTASGNNSHAEGQGSDEAIQYSQLGSGSAAIVPGAKSAGSHIEGYQTTTNNNTSAVHAEGYQTIAGIIGSGGQPGDHAEGYQTYASGGASHAEGAYTIATGIQSHAEGGNTKTFGAQSHAEGGNTTASGDQSHAEGSGTTASGSGSHAEGAGTTASGPNAHAEGFYTIANHSFQHVHGEYNIADPSTAAATARGNYAEIVGNGTADNARSNARTLDWSGNEWLAGKLTVGAGPTEDMDVATKQYVDENSGGDGYSFPVITLTPHYGQTTTYEIDWTYEELLSYWENLGSNWVAMPAFIKKVGGSNSYYMATVLYASQKFIIKYSEQNIPGKPGATSVAEITLNSSDTLTYKSVSFRQVKQLVASNWENNSQTIAFDSLESENLISNTTTILVTPSPASVKDWDAAYIICTAQSTNSLTFTCDTVPTNDITVNVVIL